MLVMKGNSWLILKVKEDRIMHVKSLNLVWSTEIIEAYLTIFVASTRVIRLPQMNFVVSSWISLRPGVGFLSCCIT